MSKRRRSPDRTKAGLDLCEMLHAKGDREGDLQTKLNGQKVVAMSKVALVGSVVHTIQSKKKEAILRYQTPLSRTSREWTH